MKGVVLHQPWAVSMVHAGEADQPPKRFETRGRPFAGLGPAGVRPLPGCRVEPGERVAILASLDRRAWRDLWAEQSPLVTWADDEDDVAWGCVVGTVRFTQALPIGGPTSFRTGSLDGDDGHQPGKDVLVVHPGYDWPDIVPPRLVLDRAATGCEDMTAQLPLGDYRPGRWAMEAVDAVQLEHPVPILGRQGVHHLVGTEPLAGPGECPRCIRGHLLTTTHHDELDWCPLCGWVDE